jgi:hypothetical protein
MSSPPDYRRSSRQKYREFRRAYKTGTLDQAPEEESKPPDTAEIPSAE